MRYELLDKPDFGMVRAYFDQPGEQMIVESSAMVARDTAIEMKTSMQGGLLSAAKRKLLGGESLFQNTFTCTQPGQQLWLAPNSEGDLLHLSPDDSYVVLPTICASAASVPTVTPYANRHDA